MARVIKCTPAVKAVPATPALYRVKIDPSKLDEVLQALKGNALVQLEAPGSGEVPASPGEVVLSLTEKEALFLRRLIGWHTTGRNTEGASIFNALLEVVPRGVPFRMGGVGRVDVSE